MRTSDCTVCTTSFLSSMHGAGRVVDTHNCALYAMYIAVFMIALLVRGNFSLDGHRTVSQQRHNSRLAQRQPSRQLYLHAKAATSNAVDVKPVKVCTYSVTATFVAPV